MISVTPAILCVLAVCAHGAFVPVPPRFELGGDERIVGGRPIKITDAPYQVSFQLLNSHMCGGSAIAPKHILTAGHCSEVEDNVKLLRIGAGSENLNNLQKFAVIKNVRHSKYNSRSVDYDVAILTLEKALSIDSSVALVAIVGAGEEPAQDETVTVTGWGTTESGGEISRTLMAVDVNIINHRTCKSEYASFNDVTDRMICAGIQTGGKDSCQGDSGGPLVSKKTKKQVGIVSWGYGCAKPDYPGVYTNIADSAIQEFIKKQITN